MDISFLLPAVLGSAIAGLAEAKDLRGKILRLIQTFEVHTPTTVDPRNNWEMLAIF